MLNSKGFSLVELVVTMAVVLALAGVSIPVYKNLAVRAEYTELVANAKIYKDAAQSAVVDLGIPDKNVVWGDSEVEDGEWVETTWLSDEIESGILVTISDGGNVIISFDEENSNYEKYVSLIERFGDVNGEV